MKRPGGLPQSAGDLKIHGGTRLVMTHHAPDHDDDFLSRMEKLCQERFKECVEAKEGMELEL